MQSKSSTREQSAGYSWRTVLRSAGIALLSSLSLLVVVGWISQPLTAAGLDSAPNVVSASLEPSANPSRLDGRGFSTSGLPASSRSAEGNYRIYLPMVAHNNPLPPPPFAVQMYGGLNASTGLTWVVASGAKWIRVPIAWILIEPVKTTPRTYNWTSSDAAILPGSEAGIHFIVTIENNPSWAAESSCGPVNDPQDLKDFIGAIVARYPKVTYWEVYNEPDRVGTCFGERAALYVDMLTTQAYPTIKAANPSAQVVMGGVAMDWFTDEDGRFDRQFLANVATLCGKATLPCFDLANFHYYAGFRPGWEKYGRDISGKAAFVRQTLVANGYSRPVINTETGWPSCSGTNTPELAARYVPKTFARALASDLLVANWYSLHDFGDAGCPGLLDPDGKPRSAYTALQTLVTVLGQAKYVRAIPSSETGAAQIEAYQFSAPGATGWKQVEVYWYECPSMATSSTDCENTAPLKINAASEVEIGVIDKLGVKTTLDDDDDGVVDGKVTITLGSSPIYIDYQP
jgi:hypothetical protein